MLRVSARALGNSGFIFGNNYIRNYPVPARRNVQIALQLPGETLRMPERPIDIPSGAYFIWPVNLRVGPALLKYSTAQLITRVARADTTTFYFFAVPGIAPEFAFAPDRAVSIEAAGMETGTNDRVYVRNVRPGNAPAITLRTIDGVTRIVVLTQEQAEHLWRIGDRVVFQPPRVGRELAVRFEKVRDADAIGPVPMFNAVTWRKVEIALAPSDSAFAAAARYRISLPALAVDDSSDVILTINYVGDVAQLYAGDVLLNDNFYNGTPWRVSARRYADAIRRGPLELRILPLRGDAPVYMGRKLNWPGQRAELVSITATTVYEETVR